ncbi:O-antigen polymerase [Arthrobacter terricola]|nr:O-antigen polymerase [Arthrobacter terricola]
MLKRFNIKFIGSLAAIGLSLGFPIVAGPTQATVSFAVLLATCGFCIFRLRSSAGRALEGSSALVVLLIAAIYAIGLVDRPGPVFGINPTGEDYQLTAIGLVSLLAGALITTTFRRQLSARSHAPAAFPRVAFGRDHRLVVIAILAMAAALLNYATGGIPILSDDVDGSRFAGNYGILGRFWPLILPILQVVVIVASTRILARNSGRRWLFLGLLALLFLLLSGGRSLFVIPLIAIGLLTVDFLRPRFRTILLSAIGGFAIIGAFGYARTLGSSGSQASISYLGTREQDSWFGALDISLQTGPRVMSAAREVIHDNFLSGQFFWADLQNFLGLQVSPSDRLVTVLLDRQPDQVGGLPPTIFGGLYLDWGMFGVILGAFVIGGLLEFFRARGLAKLNLPNIVWSYYFLAYILMSVYSYVGAKPNLLFAAVVCLFAFDRDKGVFSENSNGFKVSRVPGRGGGAPTGFDGRPN